VVGDEKLCTNCHRMTADLTRQQTGVYTDMNPCFLCHTDKIGEFAQDYIHGPVAGGTCTVCHNPHGSQFDNNLRSPVPVLCLFCHTSIYDSVDPVQHKPFADGHCVDCHDPHATGNRWVLTRESGELCISCHEEEVADGNHRHPVGKKPKTRLKRDMTLDDEGRMECLTCHQPHGGKAEFLLRTSGGHACLDCHPEYQ
jgi:predicted CXXCH cytochrome family protein